MAASFGVIFNLVSFLPSVQVPIVVQSERQINEEEGVWVTEGGEHGR